MHEGLIHGRGKWKSDRTCATCIHYGEESDGEYGEVFCGYRCEQHPAYQNLKSFPFKKKMPCHVLDFWHSKYAEQFNGDIEGSYEAAVELWKNDPTMGPENQSTSEET